MRQKLLLLFCFGAFLFANKASAQKMTVSGTVKDDQGEVIPSASVIIKGNASNGVVVDRKGHYIISVEKGATLVFSAINYERKEVVVENENLDVILSPADNTALSDVIVTGVLGIKRQKKELGYATATVSNGVLNEGKAVNIANGLQGKVSGLNITTINNGVNEDVKINLRGIRSLTGNNNPMLLLDGVAVDLNYLSSLNPNDVLDVNVLKGTSAAALYGPDARNGVIVITTKKGTAGAGNPIITLSNSTQFQKISFFPKFQTEFGSGDYGEYVPFENWQWGPAYDGSKKLIGRPLEDGSQQEITYSALPNEREKFFNTGVIVQNGVSFLAKDFFLSVQDANVKGIVPHDKNRRTSVRMNASKEYGRFKAQFNTNYVLKNYNIFDDDAMDDYNRANNVGLNGGLLNLIFNTGAHIPLTSYSDYKNNKFASYDGYYNDYGLNPYFALDNWRNTGKIQDLLSSLQLDFKAADWLNFTYRAGLTSNTTVERHTSNGITPSQYAMENRSFLLIPQSVDERTYSSTRLSSEFFGTFNKTLGDFKINAIAGTYFRESDSRDTKVSAGNLIIPNLFNVSGRTGELGGSSVKARSRLFSLYTSIGLSYKGWANVEFTGRNDKTSLLSLENNSYFYPGISGSFIATDAFPSIKSNILSFLKFRASVNKTGNADISPYLLASTFSQGDGFPYGSLPGYSADNTTYNPDLKPEFINSKEFGVEASFLNNKVNIEASYYNQNNTDQIISIRVSDATGYTNAFVNAASFTNKGMDLDLKLTPLFKIGDVDVDFLTSATYNDSKITSIYPGLEELFAGGYDNFAANYAIVGQPAFVFKATDYLRDPQGRVIVDKVTGYPSADPNTKQFGRTMPLWIVGLNPKVRWKGLEVSALFEYRGGHYAYNGIGADMAWTGVSIATAANHRERFVMPNSSYEDPNNPGQYIANTNVTVSNVNDFYTGVYRDVATNFLTSAASWRFRELSIGYDVPVSVFGKNQNVIKSLTVAVTGRNLFLWLPKSNVYTDPDFNFTTTNTSGVSTSQINPPVRTIGGSVTVQF